MLKKVDENLYNYLTVQNEPEPTPHDRNHTSTKLQPVKQGSIDSNGNLNIKIEMILVENVISDPPEKDITEMEQSQSFFQSEIQKSQN